jgi:hypothetical protein
VWAVLCNPCFSVLLCRQRLLLAVTWAATDGCCCCCCCYCCFRQVWDFSASADARDTEGGASKRSLLEQVEKMRTYLAAEQVAQQ